MNSQNSWVDFFDPTILESLESKDSAEKKLMQGFSRILIYLDDEVEKLNLLCFIKRSGLENHPMMFEILLNEFYTVELDEKSTWASTYNLCVCDMLLTLIGNSPKLLLKEDVPAIESFLQLLRYNTEYMDRPGTSEPIHLLEILINHHCNFFKNQIKIFHLLNSCFNTPIHSRLTLNFLKPDASLNLLNYAFNNRMSVEAIESGWISRCLSAISYEEGSLNTVNDFNFLLLGFQQLNQIYPSEVSSTKLLEVELKFIKILNSSREKLEALPAFQVKVLILSICQKLVYYSVVFQVENASPMKEMISIFLQFLTVLLKSKIEVLNSTGMRLLETMLMKSMLLACNYVLKSDVFDVYFCYSSENPKIINFLNKYSAQNCIQFPERKFNIYVLLLTYLSSTINGSNFSSTQTKGFLKTFLLLGNTLMTKEDLTLFFMLEEYICSCLNEFFTWMTFQLSALATCVLSFRIWSGRRPGLAKLRQLLKHMSFDMPSEIDLKKDVKLANAISSDVFYDLKDSDLVQAINNCIRFISHLRKWPKSFQNKLSSVDVFKNMLKQMMIEMAFNNISAHQIKTQSTRSKVRIIRDKMSVATWLKIRRHVTIFPGKMKKQKMKSNEEDGVLTTKSGLSEEIFFACQGSGNFSETMTAESRDTSPVDWRENPFVRSMIEEEMKENQGFKVDYEELRELSDFIDTTSSCDISNCRELIFGACGM